MLFSHLFKANVCETQRRLMRFGIVISEAENTPTYCWWPKSGVHQFRLVVYPIIYDRFYTSQVVIWDFFHQQYDLKQLPSLPRPFFSHCFGTRGIFPRLSHPVSATSRARGQNGHSGFAQLKESWAVTGCANKIGLRPSMAVGSSWGVHTNLSGCLEMRQHFGIWILNSAVRTTELLKIA